MSFHNLKYQLTCNNPHRQFISISLEFDSKEISTAHIQLPSWRPGRYELGNFAKNIRNFSCTDENGNSLMFNKLNKDLWEIDCPSTNKVIVSYEYYASEINAGSTYLDESQIYVNPVNCFAYPVHLFKSELEVELVLPMKYEIASSFTFNKTFIDTELCSIKFSHSNFDELADSPFICSDTLQHNFYEINSIKFHLWFQGIANLDWNLLLRDFYVFTNEQLNLFKSFPGKEYHFIFQILPTPFYHGVEHLNSTIIALGPGNKLMKKEIYDELLGVSCHELFHVWNVKKIRPTDMLPYDFTQENYSKLGFIYEGITTYYGDYLLYRSGVFSEHDYLTTLQEQIQKHSDNFGRKNYSVAESSFDTWLDGYVKGIPDRKVSIYTEGCLIAFLMDISLRKSTHNKHSLDDVMRTLYSEFGLKNRGYDFNSFKNILEKISNEKWDDFCNNFIFGTESMISRLESSFDFLGYDLHFIPSSNAHESTLGIKADINANGSYIVNAIYPNSKADMAGIAIGDKIIAMNGIELKSDWNDCFNLCNDKNLTLQLFSKSKFKEVNLKLSQTDYYSRAIISRKVGVSDFQKNNHTIWSSNN
ncbi:MAG: M61 family metallopeptidase [Bacteroidia bacterium]